MLTVVGTPIGNLDDLSPRAARALSEADAVCCEDTRVTGKLLAHLGVSKPLVRCDENVIARRVPEVLERLRAGEKIAYASDAGMPGVSDPGQRLVDAARAEGLPVTVVPGPTACVTALVASGIPSEHFFFEGFLPRKAEAQERRLRELAAVPGALLFYESPHRAAATLAVVARVFPGRTAALCRELTKLHEEVLRAPAPELASQVAARGALKGEVVIVVAPPASEELEAQRARMLLAAQGSGEARAASAAAPGDPRGCAAPADAEPDLDTLLRAELKAALEAGESVSAASKRLSQRFSRKKRAVYELALELAHSLAENGDVQ